MKKKITIKDVAQEAGVSVSCVSLVLNNKATSIPEETKNKIIKAAQKLNYHPDIMAQCLVTKKTHTIGILVPDIINSFFAECVKYIQVELSKYDYDIILCNSEEQMAKDMRYISILCNRHVDGLILSLSAESLQPYNRDGVLSVINKIEVPYLFLDRYIDKKYPHVIIDNEESGYKVAKLLLENGHKNFGIITGPICLNSSSNRLDGFLKCLKENHVDIKPDNIKYLKYDVESGYIGAKELLNKKDITAIFAFNDLQAYGVLKYAKEKGLKVPEDLSIVGFDDLFYSSILDTKLTTVKQPIEEIASSCCKMILRLINKESGPSNIKINTELIIRNSIRNIAQ